MKVKLTKTAVDKISYVQDGRKTYTDTELTGFGVRVGKSKKMYYAEKRVGGKTVRVNIGEHGQINTEQARKEAMSILGAMSGKAPVNPNVEKKIRQMKGISLKDAFVEYLQVRTNLKPTTLRDYRYIMKRYLHDWQTKPLNSISPQMIENRHRQIGTKSPSQANQAMRYLRAIYNFSIGKHGRSTIPDNPVGVLSLTRAWYKIKSKQTVIKTYELPALFDALDELVKENESYNATAVKDYILLLLFTGLRKQEGLRLAWERVDLKGKTFTITETKNNEPLTLPMSDSLYNLLNNRFENKTSDYVFPGKNMEGPLIEPKRHLNRIKELSGLEFSLHDIRRTFITIAESLDISHFAIKKLVNHKIGKDVTEGYIIHDAERLRKPMQQITDKIIMEAGRKGKGKVIPLRKTQV